MDNERKAKSFSLESPESEDADATSNRNSSAMAASVADIRTLEDNDYRALLNMASQASYHKRNVSASNSDSSQAAMSPAASDFALSSTGLSKDAQNIYAVLKEAADRDAFREDEAIEVRFDQKKLGKSASHESCQSKSTRSWHGRHSAFSTTPVVEVDTIFRSCLFVRGSKNDELVCGSNSAGRGNCWMFPARSVTAPVSTTDPIRCACRSPGAVVESREQEQRGLNRSYSSTGGSDTWSSNTRDRGDFFQDTDEVSAWNVDNALVDEANQEMHRLGAKTLNTKSGGGRSSSYVDKGFANRYNLPSADSNEENQLATCNDRSGNTELLELNSIKKSFDTSFLSSNSVSAHTVGGKKRRSSSQRGHNSRRQGDYNLSPSKPLADECDRMTKSELGPISGSKASRLLRKKRTQQEERGVFLSEQTNGFRGEDNIDDLVVYIEGPEALKKSQRDQQAKKAKKKSASESTNANSNNGNNSNGGAKKEKIRRSTEGDDVSSIFSSVKSGHAVGGGTLNYKHRSTDSLGLSCAEGDRRPLAAARKSTSSDGSFGASSNSPEDTTAIAPATDVLPEATTESWTEGSQLLTERSQVDEFSRTTEQDNECTTSQSAAALTIGPGDDEQFIPVTNKKQKKNKMDQFRPVASRCGRSAKGGVAGDTMVRTKRSVTPPAKEAAVSGGRQRRKSLEYPRVRGDVDAVDLKRSLGDARGTTATANEPLLLQSDSTDVGGVNSSEEPVDNKPSYANVAAHRHILSPPMLGDFITHASANKRSNKKRVTHGLGSRDDRTIRDDAERSRPRQSSSLNASRSSSPVGTPTAVATNLANASSPDLKNFAGESLTSNMGDQPLRRTYATIAKRHSNAGSASKHTASCVETPSVPHSVVDKQVHSAQEENQKYNNGQNTLSQGGEEPDRGNTQSDVGSSTDPGGNCESFVPSSNTDASAQKCLTDTAVNTEPFITSTAAGVCVPTTNLGESAFIFEQNASTSETRGTVFRKAGDRSSCSGDFQTPETLSCSNVSKSGTNPGVNITSGDGNRERRNSCPVQFLDKAGVGFDTKSTNASGLNFVYGDADDDGEICAALARSATIGSPASTGPLLEREAVIANETKVDGSTEIVVADKPSQNNPSSQSEDKIPEKVLRAMANYVNKAWSDFTRDPSSTVYYSSMANQ